ncbi:acyltransferase [Bacillus sp. DNRA2]|uniref:acyltransferase n=1 Tax=Bacillus sp. DNRA2 TaxID=2723053 RepID=UPI00145E71D9|nr:acyltransferase [Bacillus sp. DNRA2]NMD68725.1 acyltransferase [Bacillus sp. DNRA2]
MYFELLLDALFGPREAIHEVECSVCGFNEVYYRDRTTKVTLGRACQRCNFVQKFDSTSTQHRNRLT